MSSHDVGRGRGGVIEALRGVTAVSLVIGIDSDRLFPVEDQQVIAANIPANIDGAEAAVISSRFGHDGFLIEDELVSAELRRLFAY
jgi:homoserine O-acetyltransferase